MFKAHFHSGSIISDQSPVSYQEPSPRDSFHQAATRSEWAVDGYVPKPPPPLPARRIPAAPPASTTTAAKPAFPLPLQSGTQASAPKSASLIKTALALHDMDPKAAAEYACKNLPEGGLARQVMTAAVIGDIRSLAVLLARPEVLPDFTGMTGVTPLIAAAARGHTEAVELLASHPLVNLGREAAAGWTALHFAAALRHRDAVAVLLKHHAPLDILTADGKSAFDMAAGSPVEEAFRQSAHFRRYLKIVSTATKNKSPQP